MMPSPSVLGAQGPPGQPFQTPASAQPVQDPKLDNISRAKALVQPLTESLSAAMETAAQNIFHNGRVDIGAVKSGDQIGHPKFEKSLEEFYALCDQLELNLKAALECVNQSAASQRYTPLHVATSRLETPPNADVMSYTQYMSTVKTQISFAKDIHDTLVEASQNLSSTNQPQP